MMSGYTATERTARVPHECYDCGRLIQPGERYHDVVASPSYDYNPRPGHWTRGAFCLPDAHRPSMPPMLPFPPTPGGATLPPRE